MKRFAATVSLFALLSAPAYMGVAIAESGEITPQDIAEAEAQRRAVGRELAAAVADYDTATARSNELSANLAQLVSELTAREREMEVVRADAELVARELYMSRGDSGLLLLLDSESINDYPVRQGYLGFISRDDAATLSRLEAVKSSYSDQQVRLDSAIAEQSKVESDLEALSARIMRRLEEANDDYDAVVSAYEAQEAEKARRAEEERRRREQEEEERRRASTTTTTTTTTGAPDDDGGDDTTTTTIQTTTTTEPTTTTTSPPAPPPPDGAMTCPVAGATSFTDSFGAPRSGGRAHMGIDMMAARGTHAVAIEDAVVTSMGNGGLGGITAWIRGASGDVYYYAHFDAWAEGLHVGDHLGVGDLVGYVGNTGNAQYTAPHLHFELHPGGGSAVNPYRMLVELCL